MFTTTDDPDYQVLAQWIAGATEAPTCQGTRQHLVALAIAGAYVAAPAVTHAFHNGSVFDRAPGAGGGGAILHGLGARARLGLHGVPRRVTRPAARRRRVAAARAHRRRPVRRGDRLRHHDHDARAAELARPRLHALQLQRDRRQRAGRPGGPAGAISGFDPSRFYARGTSILAFDSTVSNETSWSFTWTAPAAAAGPLTINLGVVDGNGAGVAGASTLTDPLGDDVAIHAFVVRGDAAAAARAPDHGLSM